MWHIFTNMRELLQCSSTIASLKRDDTHQNNENKNNDNKSSSGKSNKTESAKNGNSEMIGCRSAKSEKWEKGWIQAWSTCTQTLKPKQKWNLRSPILKPEIIGKEPSTEINT